MHLTPAKTLTFTDPATGAVLFSAPTPCLAQIEACIRLEPGEPIPSPNQPKSEEERMKRLREGEVALPDGRLAYVCAEAPVQRQRRMLAQCLVLLCPPVFAEASPAAWVRAWLRRRVAKRWLLSLQYPQLLDLYRKLMLAVQGVDFDTVEQFEAALMAQKKSTDSAPPKAATQSSSESTI